MIDLQPAAERTAAAVTALHDDQLGLPTPCPDMTVGDLVDHMGMFDINAQDIGDDPSHERELLGPLSQDGFDPFAHTLTTRFQVRFPERERREAEAAAQEAAKKAPGA